MNTLIVEFSNTKIIFYVARLLENMGYRIQVQNPWWVGNGGDPPYIIIGDRGDNFNKVDSVLSCYSNSCTSEVLDLVFLGKHETYITKNNIHHFHGAKALRRR